MAARRANPNTVKLHYSYSVGELAVLLSVHKNTVRNWQRDGLAALRRPARSDPRGGGAGLSLSSGIARASSPARPARSIAFAAGAAARAGYGRAGHVQRGVLWKPSGVVNAGSCGGLMAPRARRDAPLANYYCV